MANDASSALLPRHIVGKILEVVTLHLHKICKHSWNLKWTLQSLNHSRMLKLYRHVCSKIKGSGKNHATCNSTQQNFKGQGKGHLRHQKMTKITRENQYEGQMFSPGQRNFLKKCFFDCGDELNKQALHQFTTSSVDSRVRKIVTEPLF